jgi:hypothetical protein
MLFSATETNFFEDLKLRFTAPGDLCSGIPETNQDNDGHGSHCPS